MCCNSSLAYDVDEQAALSISEERSRKGKSVATRRILLPILSSSVLLFSPNALPQNQQTKHFYIYNECYKPISSRLTFVASGETSPSTSTVAVSPGSQRLLGTTYKDSVEAESVSEDGSLRWRSQAFALAAPEYTHVITCKCPQNEPSCKDPDPWPSASSRQNPDGQ